MESIRSVRHLELWCGLEFWNNSEKPETAIWRIRGLLLTLRLVKTRTVICQKLEIIFASGIDIGKHRLNTYFIDREGFLDEILSSEEMMEALRGFPKLGELYIRLEENDPARYSREWWSTEIARRLETKLHSRVRVSVTVSFTHIRIGEWFILLTDISPRE